MRAGRGDIDLTRLISSVPFSPLTKAMQRREVVVSLTEKDE